MQGAGDRASECGRKQQRRAALWRVRVVVVGGRGENPDACLTLTQIALTLGDVLSSAQGKAYFFLLALGLSLVLSLILT